METFFKLEQTARHEDTLLIINHSEKPLRWKIHNDAAIYRGATQPWISFTPLTGIIPDGALDRITISFDLRGLAPGMHCAHVPISTDVKKCDLTMVVMVPYRSSSGVHVRRCEIHERDVDCVRAND